MGYLIPQIRQLQCCPQGQVSYAPHAGKNVVVGQLVHQT